MPVENKQSTNEQLTNEQLTNEEKDMLKAKHLSYIAEFNQYLPDGQKLVFNQQEFEEKLNDPAEVEQYRKGAERLERLRKQEKIYSDMISKHGEPPRDRHYLNRVFRYSFKTEDTPEAKSYNEKIYKEYVNNPEKVLYKRFQRLLNFNPKPYIDAFDDKKKLIDFYDNNQELVEDAFAFESIADKADTWLNPQLNNAIKCLKKPLEALNECQKLAFAAAGKDEYFTLPKLTPEQAAFVMGGNPQYVSNDNEHLAIRNYIMNTIGETEGVESSVDFYKKMLSKGWKADNDFYVSHVAEERDPATGEVKEVSLDAAFSNRPNVTLRARTAEEKWHIRNICKDYEREYANKWQAKYREVANRPLDIQAMERRNKGGFFERLFKTTSRQYKDFLKALKNFNDPQSKDYLNREKLRTASEAYKTHKLPNGRTIDQLDSTGKGRMTDVNNVIETLNAMDKNDSVIRRDIETNTLGIEPIAVGEQFLQKKDVEPVKNTGKEISGEIKIETKKITIEEPNNTLANS